MIDDLEAVRRIGAGDDAPDPATRQRVRARVLRPDAVRHRPSPWRRLVLVAVPAAAVAMGVALVLALGGGDPDRSREFAGQRPPVAAPSLFPAPDEFLYVRSRGRYLVCREGPGGACRLGPLRTREVWLSERRPGRLVERPPGVVPTNRLGRVRYYVGNRRFTRAELLAYRPTGRLLLRDLQRGRVPGQGGDARSYAYVQLTDALREAAMPVAVRRAIVDALPLVPGVEELGPVTDAEGRPAVAFARRSGGAADQLLVDPERLVMLEERTIMTRDTGRFRAGQQVGGAVYLERAVVDRAGERP